MKKTVLLLLIIPHFLIAQKQFSALGNTWRYDLHTFDCSNHFLRFNVEQEVEIDGKDCSVIYAYTSARLNPFVKVDDSLIVWENDSKVYFYQFDEFHLIFDFNMEIGDTMEYYLPTGKVYFSPWESEPNDTAVILSTLYVEDITEVNINGDILKKFETKYTWPDNGFFHSMENIVENIGSVSPRLFGENQAYVASGCGPNFLCFEGENYSYPPDIQCEYPTSSKNIYTDNEIKLFPNPTSDFLNYTNNTSEVIDQIQVINVNGQTVKQPKKSNSQILLNDLESGLYFIKLIFESGHSHMRKIMKH